MTHKDLMAVSIIANAKSDTALFLVWQIGKRNRLLRITGKGATAKAKELDAKNQFLSLS